MQGCSSPGPVRLAYCQGSCGGTTTVYVPPPPCIGCSVGRQGAGQEGEAATQPPRALGGEGPARVWLGSR